MSITTEIRDTNVYVTVVDYLNVGYNYVKFIRFLYRVVVFAIIRINKNVLAAKKIG